MPIPSPRAGEEQDGFIGRCMADEVMQAEYPDEEQRAAVCHSQWDRSREALPSFRLLEPDELRALTGPALHAYHGQLHQIYARLFEQLKARVGGGPLRLDLAGADPGPKPPGYLRLGPAGTPELDLVCRCAEGIPLPAGTVAEIRACRVLEHVPNPAALMDDIWRVLEANGLLHWEADTQAPGIARVRAGSQARPYAVAQWVESAGQVRAVLRAIKG